MKPSRWAEVEDGAAYVATGRSYEALSPGLYDPQMIPNMGLAFIPAPVKDEVLIRFPDSPSLEVVEEIQSFWGKGESFRVHGLPFKRGILLWGPPGSGKSATLRVLARDVIDRGGVVFVFNTAFLPAYRVFRDVQPETPLVVLMEDLDSLLNPNTESRILNILDGAEQIDRVVFLASTNYPERLGSRITDRPSRFDRRVKISHPGPGSREVYLRSLMREGDDLDLFQWVHDTDRFSLAHLKELFVGVQILGGNYPKVLKELKTMREDKAASYKDEEDFMEAAASGRYI
jgi:hypothetical protein